MSWAPPKYGVNVGEKWAFKDDDRNRAEVIYVGPKDTNDAQIRNMIADDIFGNAIERPEDNGVVVVFKSTQHGNVFWDGLTSFKAGRASNWHKVASLESLSWKSLPEYPVQVGEIWCYRDTDTNKAKVLYVGPYDLNNDLIAKAIVNKTSDPNALCVVYASTEYGNTYVDSLDSFQAYVSGTVVWHKISSLNSLSWKAAPEVSVQVGDIWGSEKAPEQALVLYVGIYNTDNPLVANVNATMHSNIVPEDNGIGVVYRRIGNEDGDTVDSEHNPTYFRYLHDFMKDWRKTGRRALSWKADIGVHVGEDWSYGDDDRYSVHVFYVGPLDPSIPEAKALIDRIGTTVNNPDPCGIVVAGGVGKNPTCYYGLAYFIEPTSAGAGLIWHKLTKTAELSYNTIQALSWKRIDPVSVGQIWGIKSRQYNNTFKVVYAGTYAEAKRLYPRCTDCCTLNNDDHWLKNREDDSIPVCVGVWMQGAGTHIEVVRSIEFTLDYYYKIS